MIPDAVLDEIEKIANQWVTVKSEYVLDLLKEIKRQREIIDQKVPPPNCS